MTLHILLDATTYLIVYHVKQRHVLLYRVQQQRSLTSLNLHHLLKKYLPTLTCHILPLREGKMHHKPQRLLPTRLVSKL